MSRTWMFSRKATQPAPACQEALSRLVAQLDNASVEAGDVIASQELQALERECDAIARSWSGSWLGYHAYVYYENLRPAPPGANFSQEWGLKDLSFTSLGSVGEWCQFDPEQVKMHLFQRSGLDDLDRYRSQLEGAAEIFEDAKSEMASLFEIFDDFSSDKFLASQREKFGAIHLVTSSEILGAWQPRGQVMTRDMVAMGQGFKVAPHLALMAKIVELRAIAEACREASKILKTMSSHIRRKDALKAGARSEGSNNCIFIGHGRSPLWRELKDFLQGRLGLDYKEFNRVSAAGIPTSVRLNEMLDDCNFAFLIMTAEDEAADGSLQARMNVIHEVGLFQSKVGFSRAIILLEDGCEEFSNISGLGQIRFPAGNIQAAFEELRLVLEREDLL